MLLMLIHEMFSDGKKKRTGNQTQKEEKTTACQWRVENGELKIKGIGMRQQATVADA